MNSKAERNSSIELLRIIAVSAVILLHYNNASMGGAFKNVSESSLNQYYLYAIESLSICAVDVFIMISASFLCSTQKRKMIKVIELVLQVIVVQIFFYFYDVITEARTFEWKSLLSSFIPNNYFVILYLALYILSPYLNQLFISLEKSTLRKLILCLLLLFSIWPTLVDCLENLFSEKIYGLSTISYYGSHEGMTMINFILAYYVGAYIQMEKITLSSGKTRMLLILAPLTIFAVSMLEKRFGIEDISSWHYYNPFVILFSATILIAFKKENYHSALINRLAQSTFTCFLIHPHIIWKMRGRIAEAVTCSITLIIWNQITIIAVSFILSYVFFVVYSLCTERIIRNITPCVNKINISLDS